MRFNLSAVLLDRGTQGFREDAEHHLSLQLELQVVAL
jgi:hypothetical protein